MNWTAAFVLAGCLQVSAAGYSQGKITLSVKNTPLEIIFASIEEQSGYAIWYDNSILKNTSHVDMDVQDVSLEQALTLSCKNQPLIFNIIGKMVVITQKNIPSGSDPPIKIDVKGRLTNDRGDAVAGVSVVVRGTKIGTMTDNEGKFEIPNIDENSILIFTGTNIEKLEEKLKSRKDLIVVVKNKINKLDEIQIIGYGTTTKRLNIGNVSTISAKEIEEQPVTNPLAALEGRIPGFYIQEYNGVPGTAFSVQLRGQNSIANGNNPLYIIDGVPFPSQPIGSGILNGGIIGGGNPLNGINSADIESIDVLKDGDATAIYGSRGANGVILISTKKGLEGQTKFDLNVFTGFGKITRRMDLLNTKNYLVMRNEALSNDQTTASPYDYDLTLWDTTRYTNWQNELIGGTARLTSVNGGVSGGSKNTQVLLNGSYQSETTVFPGDFKNQKGSVFVNLSHTSTDQRFKVTFSASYLIENSNLPSGDPTASALVLPPDAPPVFDSSGKLNWEPGFSNPYANFWSTYKSKTNNLISNSVWSYQLLKTIQIKTSLGYTQLDINETRLLPSTAINPANASYQQPSAYFNAASLNTWIIEPQIIWNKTSAGNKWEVLLGTTLQQTRNEGQTFLGTGYSSDALLENIAAASHITVQQYNNSLYRYEALFGRFNFNHHDKYLLNLVARRDGSSRFGPGKQFANFGAIGAGWIFSNEEFIKLKFKGLSFGKLRASYGITGNDQIGDYQYLSNWASTPFPYDGASGSYPQNLANQDYSWEINKKFEVGLELGFLKDAILFTTSYFHNRSSSQLVGYPLPGITGFISIQANLPAVVQNTGWEFQFSSTNINAKNFSWKTTLNLTIPYNELIAFPGLASSSYANTYQVGKSLYISKSFAYEGVDPESGIYLFQSVSTGKPTAYPVYPDDLQANKQISKKYYGGFLNSFQYKNLSLDIFIQLVKQTGRSYLYTFGAPGFLGNQPNTVLGRWQDPGELASVQKFTQDYGSPAYNAYINASYFGDNTIVDASFIRIKNISLSYQFSAKTLTHLKLKAGKVFCRVQNLFTITHYLGMDPEAQYVSNLPPLRMVAVGFQLTL